MKRAIACLAVLAALPVVPAAAQPPAPSGDAAAKPPSGSNVIAGRYIVVYESSVADVEAETKRQEREKGFKAKFRYKWALKGFAAKLSDAQVRKLRADPDVASVTPDRSLQAFAAVPLAAGEETPPAGVRRIESATGTTARQASDVAVAVIDTGIDLSHPDLNAASGTNCVTPGASAQDDEGHGTHVAGTIAAKNNGAGVVGVAPGTKLYAVKVLDSTGSGTSSQVICGIDWVTANAGALDIEVANVSLGGPGSNDGNCGLSDGDPLHRAVCRSTQAGVTYVVAAGNNGWDIGDSPPDTPAAFPEVLTVTAMSDSDGKGGGAGSAPTCASAETDDRYASFSNYATRAADAAHMIAAPGVCIRSTVPGGHGTASGTSMASPHVAGAVALCLSEGGVAGPCAGKSPAQIIGYMRSEAESHATADAAYGFYGDPLRPNEWGDYFGYLARVAQDATGTSTVEPETIATLPPPPPPPPPPAPELPPTTVIVGTSGNDVLVGTPGDDVIRGLGGNDLIRGLGGNDRIYAGARDDVVYASAGNDVVYAGRGNDVLYGGRGEDRIDAGAGRDRLVGGAAVDVLLGRGGRDTFVARDRGRDVVAGGLGRDRARVDPRLDRVWGVERLF